jgi:V-type H+-transporting ATPase subunit a
MLVWQADNGLTISSQMADPSTQDENVTLLGEEGLRAGGQALKLG